MKEGMVSKILETRHQSNGSRILLLRMMGMLTWEAIIRGNGKQDDAVAEEIKQ